MIIHIAAADVHKQKVHFDIKTRRHKTGGNCNRETHLLGSDICLSYFSIHIRISEIAFIYFFVVFI